MVEFALLVDLQDFLYCLQENRSRSIGNSDPRMRIVLIQGLNSNFNSIFEVLKTGRDFQYRPDSHVSLNPSFLLVKLDHLEAKCIRDNPLSEIVLRYQCPLSLDIVQRQQHACFNVRSS